MAMNLGFMELYDVKPGLNNLCLPIKCSRIFIRYTTRLFGYSMSRRIFLIVIRLLNQLDFFRDVSYITYLFRINAYKLEFREALFTTGLVTAVEKKNEWAEYVISQSKSIKVRLNAKVYLSLLSRHGFYKNSASLSLPVINPNLLNSVTNKKIYIYGPNAKNPPSPKYKDYLLIVLKPIELNLTDFKEKLLFVNSAYYSTKMINNYEHCSTLLGIFDEVIVSSLSKVDRRFEKAKFPMSDNLSAPQALGRVIYNLIHRFGRFSCVIEGFDFYLDNVMYESYYPTLTRKKDKVDEQIVCDALAHHDALFNFLYVKELCEYLDIHDSGNFEELYTKSGQWYLDKLQEVRSFKLLKNL